VLLAPVAGLLAPAALASAIPAGVHHEHLALAESRKLNIKTFGMVDTNSDPTLVDYVIPSNDDASKSITFVVQYLAAAIREGLEERKAIKGNEKDDAEA
jgi:small subunit ribosomal protein S2